MEHNDGYANQSRKRTSGGSVVKLESISLSGSEVGENVGT